MKVIILKSDELLELIRVTNRIFNLRFYNYIDITIVAKDDGNVLFLYSKVDGDFIVAVDKQFYEEIKTQLFFYQED